MTDIFLARTLQDVPDDRPKRIWVMFDCERTLWGKVGESQRNIVKRWFGGVIPKIVAFTRYRGVMRPSEIAMTIGELRRSHTRLRRAATVTSMHPAAP